VNIEETNKTAQEERTMIASRQVPQSGKPCWPPRKLTHPKLSSISTVNTYNVLLGSSFFSMDIVFS